MPRVPRESHWVEEAVAEVLGQITELINPPWSMSQELTLLPEQSGTPLAHFLGQIALGVHHICNFSLF